MYSKESANFIMKYVIDSEIYLAKEEKDFITGVKTLIYYYKDKETKKDHIEVMKNNGYIYNDCVDNIDLYSANIMDDNDRSVRVKCAYFLKDMKN